MKVIRMSHIKREIERKDENGLHATFSCKVFTKKGKLLVLKEVYCSSSYHKGTYNIVLPNGQVRKIRELFMVEFNGKEVMA